MNRDIVDKVVRSSGFAIGMPTQDQLLKYIQLLASTGKSEEQLLQLGSAYLKERLNPDSRYSGC
jgi:flavorubredoxin